VGHKIPQPPELVQKLLPASASGRPVRTVTPGATVQRPTLSRDKVPTVDEYVQAFLTAMRAPLKQKFMSTVAGRVTLRRDGERVIYGPNGAPIRVVEKVNHADGSSGGNQIEHGDRLHAVIRPPTVQAKLFN